MVVVEDGLVGLEVLSTRGPFAVVIADLAMPHMSGTDFLAEVSKRAPAATRVLYTAYANNVAVAKALSSGAIFRLVRKPCLLEDLLRVVHDGVAEHRKLTEVEPE